MRDIMGESVYAAACSQIQNGVAARMVLYHYDFNDAAVADPSQLSLYGHRKLDEILQRLMPCAACPVIVEATPGNPQLDACRRAYVAAMLERANVPIPVVVGVPPAGLRSDEALEIHGNLLLQTKAGEAMLNNSKGTSQTTTSP
jgi:hypothetical protein